MRRQQTRETIKSKERWKRPKLNRLTAGMKEFCSERPIRTPDWANIVPAFIVYVQRPGSFSLFIVGNSSILTIVRQPCLRDIVDDRKWVTVRWNDRERQGR
ncbi:hypothetical protein AVEN_236815-1 [Araneus ventricosus]|uniref:Uncharacterized protein n=1 Tax=Araneus ventricosus TaxID=182803 RepID=A0A4Y2NDC2_ARAVE|nr:hypothetical protein AVEN_236815-1 [Araneus ventricosus]